MDKLFSQFLAIYCNENRPNGIKISIVGLKFGQIQNKPSKNYPKTLQNLPKWQNVANSGHTVSKLKGKKKANATN